MFVDIVNSDRRMTLFQCKSSNVRGLAARRGTTKTVELKKGKCYLTWRCSFGFAPGNGLCEISQYHLAPTVIELQSGLFFTLASD